jgi:hypothetical protein
MTEIYNSLLYEYIEVGNNGFMYSFVLKEKYFFISKDIMPKTHINFTLKNQERANMK